VENQYPQDRAPLIKNVTVDERMPEYLTEKEVDRLIDAAKDKRHAQAILMFLGRHNNPYMRVSYQFVA